MARGLQPGQTNNKAGRPPGTLNKTTIEFKQAINNLIEYATPEMTQWLKCVAFSDPYKALEMVYKFAQFGYPLLARTEVKAEVENKGPPQVLIGIYDQPDPDDQQNQA